jgi:hypothetical protein
MKWTGMYFAGYAIFLIGVLTALWKLELLSRIGAVWTVIGVTILVGIGAMMAVTSSGQKASIEVDSK